MSLVCSSSNSVRLSSLRVTRGLLYPSLSYSYFILSNLNAVYFSVSTTLGLFLRHHVVVCRFLLMSYFVGVFYVALALLSQPWYLFIF